MTLETISGLDAWKIATANRYASYPKESRDKERLFPYACPAPSPSFAISRADKVFTIGSCFAREVDKALMKADINVISRSGIPENVSKILDGKDSIFNKYTIHSMLNEMRWALDLENPFPGDDVFISHNGKFIDSQLGVSNLYNDLETTRLIRSGFIAAMRNAAEADVFIATLGLAEAWFDKKTGLYLNLAPRRKVCLDFPGRFEFHVLDYDEIYKCIDDMCSLVRRYGKKGVRFLLTVSPVALIATFRDQDVLVANTYSKAVQRAALEKFIVQNEDADYFPSYETVVLTPTTEAWTPSDFRHVNPHVVRRIMSSVLSDYVGEKIDLTSLKDQILSAHRGKRHQDIIDLAEPHDPRDLDRKSAYLLGLAYKRLGRLCEALKVFKAILELYPDTRAALINAIGIARKLNSPDKEQLIEEFHRRYPGDIHTIEITASKPTERRKWWQRLKKLPFL